MQCIEDLKAVTGIFDPSLGNRDAAQSGVAIRQLQTQGSNANYHFSDNQHRSIKHTGRILVTWIPFIYDTERVVRIIGDDGEPQLVTINGPSGQKDPKTGQEKVFDLTKGKYHVVLSAGPSYATRRQEEAAFLDKVVQAFPQLMQVAGDLVFRAQDSPGAEAIADRLKKMLPPQLQDDEQGGQTPIPPQVQQQMEQAKQMIGQLSQQLHQTLDKLQQAQSGNDTKVQVAAIQEETKRLVALLMTGQKAAAVELQHTVGVLDAQADRDHAMAMAQLPPQAPPGQPGQPGQPDGSGAPADPSQSSIPAPAASSGSPAGLAPQGPTSFAGAPGAGQE
jgi:flagellar hook-basal body complex protein FliE